MTIKQKLLKFSGSLLAVVLGAIGLVACIGPAPAYGPPSPELPTKTAFNTAADCAIAKTTDTAKKASLQAAKDAAGKVSDADWNNKVASPDFVKYLNDFAAVDPGCKP